MTKRNWSLRHNRPIGPVSSNNPYYWRTIHDPAIPTDPKVERPSPSELANPEPDRTPQPALFVNFSAPSQRFDTGSFQSAVFFQDQLSTGSLRWSRFVRRDLSNAVFINVDLFASKFVECNLRNAMFYGCDLRGVFFDGPTCERTLFIDSNVENADVAFVGRNKASLLGSLQGALEPDRFEASAILSDAIARVADSNGIQVPELNYDGSYRHRVMRLDWTKKSP